MGKEKHVGYRAKTESQADHICRSLHNFGKRWDDGSSYLDFTNWHYYKNETVYVPFMNKFVNVEWCSRNNIRVLSYDKIKSHRIEISKSAGNQINEMLLQRIQVNKNKINIILIFFFVIIILLITLIIKTS